MVPTTTWKRARTKLVPAGASSVLVCRYNGDNVFVAHPTKAPQVLLGTMRYRSHRSVAGLVAQFDKLPELRPDAPIEACEPEDVAFLVYFTYFRHVLDLGIDECYRVSNGTRGALADVDDGLRLIGRLVHATRGLAAPQGAVTAQDPAV